MFFYYSGHSDGTAIELGGERLAFTDLKARLAATGADVRVLIVDSCKSGALVAKGGRRGPAFSVDLVDDLATHGEAMLTSSAADEQSLESAEIRGSFFTHHLVSGLRGAADASGDGRVTLSEAYDYAFGKTVVASADVGAAPQHPSYDYRLSGRGELVLTELGARTAHIELPSGFDRALVVAVQRDQIIAEVSSDAARRVAVAGGTYAVRLWRNGSVVAGRVTVAEGAAVAVHWDELRPLDSVRSQSKGDAVVLDDGNGLSPAAQAEYDDHMLWFGQNGTLQVNGQVATINSTYTAYLGKYRREIPLDDFYARVGRADLAKAYRDRQITRHAIQGGGVAIIGASLIVGLATICFDSPGAGDPRFKSCSHDQFVGLGAVFAGGFLGGLVFILGRNMTNEPARVDEMRQLTDDHNVKLRARLRHEQPAPSWTTAALVPYVVPGGGGATFGVRF